MGEFFRFVIRFFYVWNRKVGAVTLSMACVFTGLWVRSAIVSDRFLIPADNKVVYEVYSESGFVNYIKINATDHFGWNRSPFYRHRAPPPEAAQNRASFREMWFYWNRVVKQDGEEQFSMSMLTMHYSLLITPLTLISMFFLLTERRQSNQKKTLGPNRSPGIFWRRKVGVITLLIACVLAVGWARSTIRLDQITSCSSGSSYFFKSLGGTIEFGRRTPVIFEPYLLYVSGIREFDPLGKKLDTPVQKPHDQLAIEWRFDWLGFHFGAGNSTGATIRLIEFCIIPYWSIVLPLCLISAYLLLTKPRKSNQTEIVETARVEEA